MLIAFIASFHSHIEIVNVLVTPFSTLRCNRLLQRKSAENSLFNEPFLYWKRTKDNCIGGSIGYPKNAKTETNVIYKTGSRGWPFIFVRTMLKEELKYTNAKKQLRYDLAYLKMASVWAELSKCNRKKVGALIIKNGMIISDGYNGCPSGFPNECEDTKGNTHWYVLHAEANALTKLAKSSNSANNGTLYITLSPCKDCSKLILQAGIKRVVYVKKYKDTSGLDFLKQTDIEIVHIPDALSHNTSAQDTTDTLK